MAKLEKENEELKEMHKTKDQQIFTQAEKIRSMEAKFATLEQPARKIMFPMSVWFEKTGGMR